MSYVLTNVKLVWTVENYILRITKASKSFFETLILTL